MRGEGNNILAFKRFGLKWNNLYANELLEDRVHMMKENIPNANIYPGDALKLEFRYYFDIVFQSTVFTSILDFEFKVNLARKMWDMTKEKGMILWYDFTYDNPNNRDVNGIKTREIKRLFSKAKDIKFYRVTLAPPIARKIGKFYNLVNTAFPFLRTHVIAEIYK